MDERDESDEREQHGGLHGISCGARVRVCSFKSD